MQVLRIGMIGAGTMGQCAHLRNFVCADGCEVVALAELRPKLAELVAQRYGIDKVYRDHREMLARQKLDAIVSIQPFQIHGALVPELLEARVPVMIEKPLARSIEAGEKILAVMQPTSKLFLGYHKRSDPATIFAKKQIDEWRASGEVGAMRYVRITMPPGDWIAGGFSHCIKTDEAYPNLAFDPSASKEYEAFVNYYIHQVNLMRHLMGENYRVTFADRAGVIMAVESASGITGVLEMQPYQTTGDWQEQALVTFERGWIRIELVAPLAIDRAGRVTIFADGKPPRTTIPSLPPIHAMRQQAIHFIAAARGESTPLCEAREGLDDLRIATQYHAARH